jgi:hypothetical protein
MTTTTGPSYATAPNRVMHAGNGIDYAYRELGTGARPLVLLQHFRGNLENWDPPLVDALARERRVVAFDNVGIGATTGTTPNTMEQMAHDALFFIDALGSTSRHPRLLHRQLCSPGDRTHSARRGTSSCVGLLSATRGRRDAWVGPRGD